MVVYVFCGSQTRQTTSMAPNLTPKRPMPVELANTPILVVIRLSTSYGGLPKALGAALRQTVGGVEGGGLRDLELGLGHDPGRGGAR